MVAAPQSPSNADSSNWYRAQTVAAGGRVIFEWHLSSAHANIPFFVDAAFDPQRSAEREFLALADQWHAETGGQSAPSRIISNDAYLRIIGMGEAALPFILRDLRDRGGFWYPALRAIAGEWPVPEAARGRPRLMKDAWFQWARERGIEI